MITTIYCFTFAIQRLVHHAPFRTNVHSLDHSFSSLNAWHSSSEHLIFVMFLFKRPDPTDDPYLMCPRKCSGSGSRCMDQGRNTKAWKPAIISAVLEMIEPGVFPLLELPQLERAVAIKRFLPQILPEGDVGQDHGVYVNVVHVPRDSDFWRFSEYWNIEDTPCEADTVAISYIGSTARTFSQRVWREHEVQAYRAHKACFHYRAIDAGGGENSWFRLGSGMNQPAAIIRLLEEVMISLFHTYKSPLYTSVEKIWYC